MSLAAVNCKPCPNALARAMPFTACAGLDPGAFDPVRVSGQRTRAFNDSVAALAPNAAALPVAAQAVGECARAPRQTGGPVWPAIPRSRDCIDGPCRVRHTDRFGGACSIVLELALISPAGRSSQSPHSACGSNEPSPIIASAWVMKSRSAARC
jgi:hypothetical protein